MKLTGWYDGDQKPLPDRVGPYLRLYENGRELYCWWDGVCFKTSYDTPEHAEIFSVSASFHQSLPWRGVER